MKNFVKPGAFSLVEAMMLLLIVSLMLASGVTVVSKKHLKVPKMAMHGAYMCYYLDGRLHEEKYVGSGLDKKILDRDVTECRFTPPEKAGYMYIQATSGGGGGGDSGYHGGRLEVYESKTEVLSPFGITQGLLDLKGISASELENFGGKIWAYANATGKNLTKPGGDAGDGGDVYYIEQDCSEACLVNREWKYTGSDEKKCSCTSGKKYSDLYTYNYSYDCSYWDTESCTGTNCDHCDSYKTEPCSGPECDVCNNWQNTDDEGKYSYHFKCKSGYNKTTYCEDGYNDVYVPDTCYGTCTNEKNVPVSASCAETDYSNLTVQTKDTYAQDTGYNPPYRMDYKTGCTTCTKPQLTVAKEKDERKVLRDESPKYDICNYGNTSIFTGVSDGIFGSFIIGYDPVDVTCDTDAVTKAFGLDLYPIGGGQAAIAEVVIKATSDVFDKKYEYLKTEDLGLDAAFGNSCTNIVGGTCKNSTKNNTSFKNPVTGNSFPTTKSLPTDCNLVSNWTTKDGEQGCDGKNTYGTPTHTTKEYPIYTSCRCNKNNSDGSECMYNFSQVSDENKRCMYIPQVVKGGIGGTGRKCRTNDVKAGLGRKFIAKSDVIPGTRGTDKNCTNSGYMPLYTKAQWNNQLGNCFADNGTDSIGSASVNLNGDICEVNMEPPTKGQGARKTTAGGTIPTAGQNAPVNGSGRQKGTISGGNENFVPCGENHVGYCLVRSAGGTTENGKYTYKYTWNTNYLQYGKGGKAGGYNSRVIRTIRDSEFLINPGHGGKGGAEGTGDAGENGGDTTVQFITSNGDAAQTILFIQGGAGGTGGHVFPTEDLPKWFPGGDFYIHKNGTPGEVAIKTNFKANIMNLVLPMPTNEDDKLSQWLKASGDGGDGGGSRNHCWASEWQRWFEGQRVKGNLGMYLDASDMETYGCRKGVYWSATPVARDGISGVVVITW